MIVCLVTQEGLSKIGGGVRRSRIGFEWQGSGLLKGWGGAKEVSCSQESTEETAFPTLPPLLHYQLLPVCLFFCRYGVGRSSRQLGWRLVLLVLYGGSRKRV